MDNADVVLELTRDDQGRVTRVAFKLNAVEGSKKAIECLDMTNTALEAIFASEGPEDHSVSMQVDFSFGGL
jgi:hypothetical protein